MVGLTVIVRGQVQGVGFRFWTYSQATSLDLQGSAVNQPDGSVLITVDGPRDRCQQLLDRIQGDRAPGKVRDVEVTWGQPRGRGGFRVG